MRLHETLKQCQDLKTEKNQMDRKINQLSEENGDLSFKVSVGRGYGSCSHLEALGVRFVWTIPQERVGKNVPPGICPVLLSLQRPAYFAPVFIP